MSESDITIDDVPEEVRKQICEQYLEDLRNAFFAKLPTSKGAINPVSGQRERSYSAKLNRCYIYALMLAAKLQSITSEEYFTARQTHLSSRVMSTLMHLKMHKLAFWGLLKTEGNRSGRWKVTELGDNFLSGSISVSRQVHEYHTTGTPVPGDEVYIHEVFGEDINFKQKVASTQLLELVAEAVMEQSAIDLNDLDDPFGG